MFLTCACVFLASDDEMDGDDENEDEEEEEGGRAKAVRCVCVCMCVGMNENSPSLTHCSLFCSHALHHLASPLTLCFF